MGVAETIGLLEPPVGEAAVFVAPAETHVDENAATREEAVFAEWSPPLAEPVGTESVQQPAREPPVPQTIDDIYHALRTAYDTVFFSLERDVEPPAHQHDAEPGSVIRGKDPSRRLSVEIREKGDAFEFVIYGWREGCSGFALNTSNPIELIRQSIQDCCGGSTMPRVVAPDVPTGTFRDYDI
jgi:hypothetical protein